MGRAWLFSSVLHVVLATLLYFGLPGLTRPPPAMERAITVELVTEAPETAPAPPTPEAAATAPEPARSAASPNPTPPTPPPAPEPEPEPEIVEPAPEPAPPPPPEPEVVEPAPEPAPPPPPEPAVVEPEPAPAPPPVVAEPEPAPVPEPPPEPEPEVVEAEPELPIPEPAPTPAPEVVQPAPAPRPAPPPAPKPQLKPAPPKVAERAPPPEPKPAPKPEPPQEDAFAAMLKSVEEIERRVEAPTVQAGRGRAAPADGQARSPLGQATLSFSERSAVEGQIYRCWILPVGIEGIDDMSVKLRIQVRPDRTVQSVMIEDQGRLGRDPIFRAVAESARRAVDKCSPLNLPPGKYAVWRDIGMTFYPQNAING